MLSQARSWHGHAIGEMALVQQRSPAAHIQGFAHRLFVNSRIHLVCPLSRAFRSIRVLNLISSTDNRRMLRSKADPVSRTSLDDGSVVQVRKN